MELASREPKQYQQFMIIDAHAHLVPQSWFNPNSPPAIFDPEGLLKAQDEAGVDMTLFGNNWIRTPADKTPFDIVVEFNAFAAETTQNHPARLQGLACTVPGGGRSPFSRRQ